MNLNQLRIFAAAAAEGSVSGAARALRVSQPAISKQLGELESALGVRLFDRLARGVRLTEAGRLLDTHARRIFQSEAQAEAEMRAFVGMTQGRLSIGASTTIGSYLVPGLFGAFRQAHPEIALSLEIGNTATVQAAVRDNAVDFGMIEGLVDGDEFEVEVFAHDEVILIASREHPIHDGQPLTVHDLAQTPLLMRERGSGTRDVVEAALAAQKVQVEPLMRLGSTEALKSAVAAGLGVALVSRLTVGLELQAGVLRQVDVAGWNLVRALHLVRLKGKTPSPAVASFLDLLRARS